MVKLIANRSMRYAGRRLSAGDVFEARPKDARLLTLVRRADRYVEPAPAEPSPMPLVSVEPPAPAAKPAAKRGRPAKAA